MFENRKRNCLGIIIKFAQINIRYHIMNKKYFTKFHRMNLLQCQPVAMSACCILLACGACCPTGLHSVHQMAGQSDSSHLNRWIRHREGDQAAQSNGQSMYTMLWCQICRRRCCRCTQTVLLLLLMLIFQPQSLSQLLLNFISLYLLIV